VNNKKSWLMTRAFEKAEDLRDSLTTAMAMPIETEEEKAAKISTVKDIYEKLGVGEDAKEEIKRLHTQAMAHIDTLNLTEEKANTLRNYATTLLGRNK
jgi:geranylgeranyl pyrophosphate synthase